MSMEKISSAEAKKHFFLTPTDLRSIPYESESFGFGCGPPTKWYNYQDVRVVAIAKHGNLENLHKMWNDHKKCELKQKDKVNTAKQAEATKTCQQQEAHSDGKLQGGE